MKLKTRKDINNGLFIYLLAESFKERHEVRQLIDMDKKKDGISEHKGYIFFGTEGGIALYIKNHRKENKWKKIFKYLFLRQPLEQKTGCVSTTP